MNHLLALAFIISPFICLKLSKYLKLIDYPDKKIKLHKKAVPYVGGLSLILISISFFIFKGFNILVMLISCFTFITWLSFNIILFLLFVTHFINYSEYSARLLSKVIV